LIFNGLEIGEVIVVQPLINVLEGTLVEVQGMDQGQGQKEAKATKPGKE